MKSIQFYFLLFLVLTATLTFAQVDVEDKADWKDRIYTGGGFGFNGGTDRNGNKYFNFSVSPIIGYMITPQFSAGAGVSYQRISYPDYKNYNYSQYGFMPFLRYNFKELFLTAEYNYINLPQLNASYSQTDRIYRSRMLVGAGYSKPIGSRARVNAVAMYDLLYQRPSVFYSPWVFRVFLSF